VRVSCDTLRQFSGGVAPQPGLALGCGALTGFLGRVKQENVTLLKEVNELRREMKSSKAGSGLRAKGRNNGGPANETRSQLEQEAVASALQQVAALQDQVAALRLALADKCGGPTVNLSDEHTIFASTLSSPLLT
jgi:hypothetical protein